MNIDEISGIEASQNCSLPDESIRAKDFDSSGVIERTEAQREKIVSELSSSCSLVNPTLLSATGSTAPEAVHSALQAIEQEKYPYIALEAVKAGSNLENHLNDQLNQHIGEIETKQKQIGLLLNLNGELSTCKDEETHFSDKAKEIIEQLQEEGIEIPLSNAAEVKRQCSARESKIKNEIQIIFTTKVQRLLQQSESMNQILQSIIRYDERLKQKTQDARR